MALNNLAVSLMAEWQQLRRAHLVLKDAVTLLRFASSERQSTPVHSSRTPAGLVCDSGASIGNAERLRRASQWLNSDQSRFRSSTAVPFHVVSDDPTCYSASGEQRKSGSSAERLVRIESTDFEEVNADRVVAIVSYNFGASFLCQAKCASGVRRQKLLAHAVTVLRASSNMVRLMEKDGHEERWLFIGLLIETTLVQTLVPLGHSEEARFRLTFLRVAAQQLEAYCHVLRLMGEIGSLAVAPAA